MKSSIRTKISLNRRKRQFLKSLRTQKTERVSNSVRKKLCKVRFSPLEKVNLIMSTTPISTHTLTKTSLRKIFLKQFRSMKNL